MKYVLLAFLSFVSMYLAGISIVLFNGVADWISLGFIFIGGISGGRVLVRLTEAQNNDNVSQVKK